MIGWQEDKAWTDRHLPEISRILGEYLIREPEYRQEDMERNTDLIVLGMSNVRVGVRLRQEQYAEKYAHQFTIRASRPNGGKTELAKILEGWGDYFFYGFVDDQQIIAYTLADLRVFRLAFQRKCVCLPARVMPGEEKKNHDGSSSFRVFNWVDFPPEMIVAQKVFEPALF